MTSMIIAFISCLIITRDVRRSQILTLPEAPREPQRRIQKYVGSSQSRKIYYIVILKPSESV